MADVSYNEQERIARQLESIEGRFEELSIRITLPEVISDSALFTRLMREHSEMEELNTIAVDYRRLREEIEAAKELLNDPDMKEMAEEELQELNTRYAEKTQEARIALLPKDPDDHKTPFWKFARARAAMKPASSARSCCACTCTTPHPRAGRPKSSKTAPRSWAA